MVEYGHGVGQVSGQSGGGGGAGGGGFGSGGPTDLGASVTGFISESVDRVAALPPEMLLLLVVLVFAGLVVLRRAF
jgi:hypothetical protein